MRSLATLTTTDLAAMFAANRANAEVLESVRDELGYRTHGAARRLRAEVERELRGLPGAKGDLMRERGVRLEWLRRSTD